MEVSTTLLEGLHCLKRLLLAVIAIGADINSSGYTVPS